MTLVKDPVARAEKASSRLQAARLHQQLETELALNDSLPPEWETDAEQALAILEGRYDADELRDPTVAAGTARDGFIPSMSSGAKRGLEGRQHGGRRRSGAPKRTTTATGSSSPRPAGKRPAGSSRRPARSSRRAGRALERTGLPGAADNATGLLLQLVGVTVGLTLIYVLIRGNGPRAIAIAGASFTNGLRAFIAPVDPLAPKAKPRAGGTAAVPVPGNAYERGIAAGRLAGPPAPGLAPRLTTPTTHSKVIPR